MQSEKSNKSQFRLSPSLNPNRVFILQKSELEKRFDPFFYVPELLELERKVLAKKPKKLRDYVLSVSSGATPKRDEEGKYYSDKENGIPFLRVQNVTEFGLDLTDVKFINKETHEGYLKRSQISEGDLIVTITGRIASAAVAPEGFIGNTNQHSVVIKTDSKEVSEKLAAYLNCSIGQKLANRLATGGTRPALDYPALLSIPIIEDKRILQITDKVIIQKQKNEAEAEKLLSSIDDYLLKELGIKLPEPPENTLKNRMFAATLQEITGGRFDPKLYSTQSKELIKSLYKTNYNYQTLKSVIIQSCSGDWGNDDKEVYNENEFVRCLVIRATEFDNKFNLNVDGSRAKYRLINKQKYEALDIQANDLLIEKSGGSEDQPVGRIAILTKEYTDSYSIGFSNFVHKIRVNDNVVNPEFVFNYLKTIHNIKITDVMQSQTNGIRNLILNEYLNLPIPIPPLAKQKEIAEHITGIRQQAQQLKDQTKELLKKASEEIEEILLN
jgi:restriction endonuclease S subunit